MARNYNELFEEMMIEVFGEKHLEECALCHTKHNAEEMHIYNVHYICDDCYKTKFEPCEECGKMEYHPNLYERDGKKYCSRCLNELYPRCNCCGDRHPAEELEGVRGGHVCPRCFANEYIYCDECEEYVSRYEVDYDAGMCNRCASSTGYYVISSYHSHNYEFIGNYNRKRNLWYKGIELEVDRGDNRNACARDIHRAINSEKNHVFFETDGSLDDGFEIISHAHLIDDDSIDWKKIMDIARDYNFTSHDNGNCGLHLHYDRNFFGRTNAEREYNIGKLIAFYEMYFDDFLKASRRTQSEFERWANRYYATTDKDCSMIAKNQEDYSRYHAVNLTKRNTIEFRLGRGTLNIETFNAWNDLHDCLIKNIKKCTYKDIFKTKNVEKFLKGIKPETIAYLHSKNAFTMITA